MEAVWPNRIVGGSMCAELMTAVTLDTALFVLRGEGPATQLADWIQPPYSSTLLCIREHMYTCTNTPTQYTACTLPHTHKRHARAHTHSIILCGTKCGNRFFYSTSLFHQDAVFISFEFCFLRKVLYKLAENTEPLCKM